MEFGDRITRTEGIFAFIIPNNWMTINTNLYLRKYVLQKTQIQVINFTKQVFENADVDSSILLYRNESDVNSCVSLAEATSPTTIEKIIDIPCEILLREKEALINIDLFKHSEFAQIVMLIEKYSLPLSPHFATVKAGLQAYEVGKGVPALTDEMKKSRVYHTQTPSADDYYKYIDGSDVKRYCLTWERKEYLKYGANLAAPRTWRLFSTPRILVRQIPSQPPHCICAAYTDDIILNDRNSMNIVDITCNPLFLLGVINSKVVSFWFMHKFGKLQRGLFPQFKVNELSIFPIPNASAQEQSYVAELVTRRMSSRGKDVDAIEKELDTFMFKLFKLPPNCLHIIA